MWRSNQLSYRTSSRPAPGHGLRDFHNLTQQEAEEKDAMPGDMRLSIDARPCAVPVSRIRRRLCILHGNRPDQTAWSLCSRKEVFQPHLPVRLPCYDLAPITCFTLGRSSRSRTSGTPDFHGLTGGVYKARERIHRAMADARLLANPASWGRVADPSPN